MRPTCFMTKRIVMNLTYVYADLVTLITAVTHRVEGICASERHGE